MKWYKIQYYSSLYRVDETTRVKLIERQYSSMSKAQVAADKIGNNLINKGVLRATNSCRNSHGGCCWAVEVI